MNGRMVVIDASVAIAWLSQEPSSDAARRLMTLPIETGAPDIVFAELANALRRKERMGLLSATVVRSAIATARQTFVAVYRSHELIADAVALSQSLDQSVYDCLYLAVSRLLDAPLITLDRKFIDKLAGTVQADRVMHLHDWSPS